jgi:hypothetical protein
MRRYLPLDVHGAPINKMPITPPTREPTALAPVREEQEEEKKVVASSSAAWRKFAGDETPPVMIGRSIAVQEREHLLDQVLAYTDEERKVSTQLGAAYDVATISRSTMIDLRLLVQECLDALNDTPESSWPNGMEKSLVVMDNLLLLAECAALRKSLRMLQNTHGPLTALKRQFLAYNQQIERLIDGKGQKEKEELAAVMAARNECEAQIYRLGHG